MAKFQVLRQHTGDKDYFAGDVREADLATVAHLVASGVLAEVKAEPAIKNKSITARAKK